MQKCRAFVFAHLYPLTGFFNLSEPVRGFVFPARCFLLLPPCRNIQAADSAGAAPAAWNFNFILSGGHSNDGFMVFSRDSIRRMHWCLCALLGAVRSPGREKAVLRYYIFFVRCWRKIRRTFVELYSKLFL